MTDAKTKTYKLNPLDINRTTWCYSSRSNKTIDIYQKKRKSLIKFYDKTQAIRLKVTDIKKILKELSRK